MPFAFKVTCWYNHCAQAWSQDWIQRRSSHPEVALKSFFTSNIPVWGPNCPESPKVHSGDPGLRFQERKVGRSHKRIQQGGPGGPAPSCPQDCFKIMQCSGNFKEKTPYFEQILGTGLSPGVKSCFSTSKVPALVQKPWRCPKCNAQIDTVVPAKFKSPFPADSSELCRSDLHCEDGKRCWKLLRSLLGTKVRNKRP